MLKTDTVQSLEGWDANRWLCSEAMVCSHDRTRVMLHPERIEMLLWLGRCVLSMGAEAEVFSIDRVTGLYML